MPFGLQCGGEHRSCRDCDILDYNACIFYLPMAGLYAISATLCFDTGATSTDSGANSNVAISVTPVGGTGFHRRTVYAKVPKATAASAEPAANFSVSIYTEIEVYCACQMVRIDVSALDGNLTLRGAKNAPNRDLVTFASVRLVCRCPPCPSNCCFTM